MTPQQLQQHIIDNILPKEIKAESEMGDFRTMFDMGYNQYFYEIKALLPKIIEYVINNKDE